jgi:hypothetical protein
VPWWLMPWLPSFAIGLIIFRWGARALGAGLGGHELAHAYVHSEPEKTKRRPALRGRGLGEDRPPDPYPLPALRCAALRCAALCCATSARCRLTLPACPACAAPALHLRCTVKQRHTGAWTNLACAAQHRHAVDRELH